MAKKAPAKKVPAKRKPAKRKPVVPAVSPVKSSSPWRRSMLVGGVVSGLVVSFLGGVWSAGGWQIGPEPHKSDAVSAVFDAQESAFRKYAGELAAALRSGQVKSESDATVWFDSKFGPESQAAWTPLLTAEAEAFGGKEWTAEKHAAHIERYAR